MFYSHTDCASSFTISSLLLQAFLITKWRYNETDRLPPQDLSQGRYWAFVFQFPDETWGVLQPPPSVMGGFQRGCLFKEEELEEQMGWEHTSWLQPRAVLLLPGYWHSFSSPWFLQLRQGLVPTAHHLLWIRSSTSLHAFRSSRDVLGEVLFNRFNCSFDSTAHTECHLMLNKHVIPVEWNKHQLRFISISV